MPNILDCGVNWKDVFWPDTNFQHLLDFALREGPIEHFQCPLLQQFPDAFLSATGYDKDKSSANYTAYLYLCAFCTYGAIPVKGQSDFAGMNDILDELSEALRQVASEYGNLHPSFGLYTDRENVRIMLQEYVDELSRSGFSFKPRYS